MMAARLYQTFYAEVVFKQGKIKKASFVKDSPQHDAGTTYVPVPTMASPDGLMLLRIGFKGRIYVREQRVQISADRKSVVFTRKVEGSPSLWVLSLDKLLDTGLVLLKPLPIDETILGSMGNLPTIWNTLRLEVTAEETRPTGEGSEFPSHRFWLGEQEFESLDQVQPSSYFVVD